MTGWPFQRRAERGDGPEPAWLTAPGIENGAFTALDPWSEPVADRAAPPPPDRHRPLPQRSHAGGAVQAGAPASGPATSWDVLGAAPDRVRDEIPPPPSPASYRYPADQTAVIAGPSAEHQMPRSSAVVAMQAGHRFTVDDGTQVWVGGAGLPTAPATYDVPAAAARPLEQHRRRRASTGHTSPPSSRTREAATRPTVAGQALLECSVAALDPVGDAEAAAFAARFTADYLSYDEDDPALRAQVLRGYLADPSGATLGWSGVGRQRAEIVLPGRTLRTAEGMVVVEVTARVTPYHRAGPRFTTPDPDGELPPRPASTVGPSCAPAPAAPGWVAGPAQWVRIAPPVRRDVHGALVIDIGPTAAPDEPRQQRRSTSDLGDREPGDRDPGLGDPAFDDVVERDAR